jgi:hypothetical protein
MWVGGMQMRRLRCDGGIDAVYDGLSELGEIREHESGRILSIRQVFSTHCDRYIEIDKE